MSKNAIQTSIIIVRKNKRGLSIRNKIQFLDIPFLEILRIYCPPLMLFQISAALLTVLLNFFFNWIGCFTVYNRSQFYPHQKNHNWKGTFWWLRFGHTCQHADLNKKNKKQKKNRGQREWQPWKRYKLSTQYFLILIQ